MMKELLEFIVKSLVDNPDEVRITEAEDAQKTVYELRVTKEDIGKVIGKQGRTAHALRAILGAAAARRKKRVALEILE
ncbi:MAG: KH domain-containing protein [Desulfovibrio sp.]|jgi:predicted RNA-binding protein YlqC (UPF0109 family)|nr:KH domain-containing protein [Desulfovibrio sp.]